jgi:hypothetical protein
MIKYATTLAPSLNKKLNGQHHFLPYKVGKQCRAIHKQQSKPITNISQYLKTKA